MIFYISNSLKFCFLFKLSKRLVSCSLVPVRMKNISSMNHKSINENPWKEEFIYIYSQVIHENICIRWCTYHTHFLLFEDTICSLTQILFKVKARTKNVVITFFATFLLVCLSIHSFTAFIHSSFMIFVYKGLTSRDSK